MKNKSFLSNVKRSKLVSFKDSLNRAIFLIKKSNDFIFTMFLVLFISGLIGLTFPGLFEEQVLELIKKIFEDIGDKKGLALVIHIFLNNFQASFFAMILGIFFGLFPIIIAVINGYIIGFTINYVVSNEGILVLWKLFPHGIFEIPAIIISLGVGLYLGNRFIEEKFNVKKEAKRLIIIFGIGFLAIPFFIAYTFLLSGINSETIIIFTGSQTLIMVILASINLLALFILVYIIYIFFKNKKLKRDLIDSLWLFVLIIFPLLVIAGIIEGVLITLLS